MTTPSFNRFRQLKACLLFTFLLILHHSSSATSIQQLSFEDLCEKSELIFEGKVLSVKIHESIETKSVYTTVDFEVNEVIKGKAPSALLTLYFYGGKSENLAIEVDSLIYPEEGEHGIYFIESISHKLVNPILGWSQGHYKVVRGEMTNALDEAVVGINTSGSIQSGLVSNGRATGLVTDLNGNTSSRVMTALEFKTKIRDSLDQLDR